MLIIQLFACSQLLPHASNIVRLLTEYFRRAALPSIRIKVYFIMQTLLISFGVGMLNLIIFFLHIASFFLLVVLFCKFSQVTDKMNQKIDTLYCIYYS